MGHGLAAVLAGACLAVVGASSSGGLACGLAGDGGTSGRATLSVDWNEPIDVAAGNAHRGPWRMNDSEFDFVDDGTVAMNSNGLAAVAWADHPKQDIFLQVYDDDGEPTLDEPVNMSRSDGIFSWLPRLVITDTDPVRIYALWQDIVFSGGSHGGEIFFARSEDGGESFSEPVNLSDTTAGAGKGRVSGDRWHNGSLDLVIGPQGDVYAAWTEYEGRLHVARSTDRGVSFSEPLLIADDVEDAPARAPALAVDPNGTVHLAWTVGENRSADIHLATSRDRGRSFSEPRTVGESDGYSDAPALAVDHRGELHLVYSEHQRGPFTEARVMHTRMTLLEDERGDSDDDDGAGRASSGGRKFLPPRDISGPHGEEFAGVAFPTLSVDGDGRVYVLWECYPEPRRRPRGLGLAVSSDSGRTFSAHQVVPGTDDSEHGFNGSQQGLLMRKLAVNDSGRLAVVHSEFRDGELSRVRLLTGQASASDEYEASRDR